MRPLSWCLVAAVGFGLIVSAGAQTEIAAARITPNLVDHIDRPLRYRPDGEDFVIENGTEFFNRSLYGGHTAFRVDGGDKPEFVLYLPGRGGNLRFGVRTRAGAKWLHDAAQIETRYRPGELIYAIRDPLLGPTATVRLAALAYEDTDGLIVRIEARGLAPGAELIWAYGGVNGQRGKRDGDIGTESMPISQWFQLRPEFCHGNAFDLGRGGFTLRARAATIGGVGPAGAQLALADAARWNDLPALLESRAGEHGPTPGLPVALGSVALVSGGPVYLSLQRMADDDAAGPAADLETYRDVTSARNRSHPAAEAAGPMRWAGRYTSAQLPQRFAETEAYFTALRHRVAVDTPDAFLNAAVGALNVAADALWDEPQQAIMHGAIAWRTKLLGWRGPYSLDALGWHDRARKNALYWVGRQNTDPIPDHVPPPEERWNLSRHEAGLHTNGDMSNSHYDMNLVFIDALFRHLEWTGDLAFARQVWPAIQRHLAWERRLFRREYGPEKLPLYEAYAAIWASDDLQYGGGGTAHASAYNYYENRQAARLARLLGADSAPYDHEADLIARAMRQLLWVDRRSAEARVAGVAGRNSGTFGWFAEYKDWLGRQRVHPSAALWTFYHTVDSEVPTPEEAWQMTQYVDAEIPHLPVRGPGVPGGLCTLATSDWMPYDWSTNNVVMGEALHAALAMWEAGRPSEAWSVAKGSVVAAMFMGISPGNVGSMSYLDVYRRESQRDFGDGAGVMSRALIEGVFGVRPDALAGELRVIPGWPADWDHAAVRHPDFALEFRRAGERDTYVIEQPAPGANHAESIAPMTVRLRVAARSDQIADVLVDGRAGAWHAVEPSVGHPQIEVIATVAARHEIVIRWSGRPIDLKPRVGQTDAFRPVEQGQMHWLQPIAAPAGGCDGAESPIARDRYSADSVALEGARFDPVDLSRVFNDRVTQIFKHEYRAPRSPFVSLALPKQGMGGWAGGVNRTAVIDDAGLRGAARRGGGRIMLPNGVPLLTPAEEGPNVVFTSQWDNFPREMTVALTGRARGVYLMMAGSTGPMQSRFENGEVVVTYADGSAATLPLINPTNWWPIDEDYFIDDFQFRRPEPLPMRIDLETGRVRSPSLPEFKGRGGPVVGGAATVLALPLSDTKELRSLTVRSTANEVVIGLMAATLVR